MNAQQDKDRVIEAMNEDLSSNCRSQVLVRRPSGTRILFVTNAGGFGGTEKHLLDLIERIRSSGAESRILQLGMDSYTQHVGEEGILRIDLPPGKIRNSLWLLVKLFRKTRPDVVVFINSWVRSFPWHSSFTAFLAGVPKRFSIHHLIAPPLEKVEGWSVGKVLRRLMGWRTRTQLAASTAGLFFHKIICVSDAVRNRLVIDYRFPARKTITIHNGVSISEFTPSETNRFVLRAKLGLDSGEFLLVCVARLSAVKGIDILLGALAQIVHRGLRCKCVIVGDGPLREALLAQAEALALKDHVFFEGFHTDVRPYLQSANAFVLTSHEEGFPLSILEAMACGLPCLVTDVGGNSEAVQHLVQGLVVAPGSPERVADAISYLVTHPSECSKMSKNAVARVRESFDIKARMADLERLILG
jgi:glycosyltransferase involved in cell wall biosynthesis